MLGRAGYDAFLRQGGDHSAWNTDTTTVTSRAVAADEVLFRRKHAPVRYAESDLYIADTRLDPTANPNQKLPDSDLVKYVHAYASSFYSGNTKSKGKIDWKSMDETALLALGILLEETAKEKLGETGDLAFIEDRRGDLPTGRKEYWNGERWVTKVLRKRTVADRIRKDLLLPVSARRKMKKRAKKVPRKASETD